MNSMILGKINFVEESLEKEVKEILKLKFSQNYSDFSIGEWKTCILWNGTGFQEDSTLKEYKGKARPTELGKQLKYINYIIHNTFNHDCIRWVRIFLVRKGLIIPHKDYLELKEGFIRVHIPLQTDLTCLHSEGDQVYHMRKGEIWFLDGNQPHSACSLADTTRISLCIDFKCGIPFEEIFKDPKEFNPSIDPYIIERPYIHKEYETALQSLSHIIREDNFDEILSILAKVHFFKQVNALSMYNWLIDITQKSGNNYLIEKALKMKSFFIGERKFEEVLAR